MFHSGLFGHTEKGLPFYVIPKNTVKRDSFPVRHVTGTLGCPVHVTRHPNKYMNRV